MQKPNAEDLLVSMYRQTVDMYRKTEEFRICLWEQVNALKDVPELLGDPGERLHVAHASFEDGVLRVTVEGPPPHRKAFLRSPKLRAMWCYTVADAVQELRHKTGLPVTYEQALVQLVCWSSVNMTWDADNVGFRYMVNGLVLARVIPDDSWDRVAVLIGGGVDRRRPRTDIYVEDAAAYASAPWFARMFAERSDAGEAEEATGQERQAVSWSDIIIRKRSAPDSYRKRTLMAQNQNGYEKRPENRQKRKPVYLRRKGMKNPPEEVFW